jgi:hypothetical protein
VDSEVQLKTESVVEVQRHRRNEFQTPPPTWVTITRLRDKFETDGTARDVNKADLEDLAVQITVKVLRQCYRPSHKLHRSL